MATEMTVTLIDDPERFAAMRKEWGALLASSTANSIFLTWEWLHAWWTHLRGDHGLALIEVRRGEQLAGLAPLCLRPGLRGRLPHLEFLGAGAAGSDYLDLILRSGYEQEALDEIAGCLAGMSLPVRLSNLRRHSSSARLLAGLSRLGHWTASETTINVCPYVAVSGLTWQSYLAGRGPSHRQNFQRRLRSLQRDRDLRFERAATHADRVGHLRVLRDLHEKRWAPRGGSDAFTGGDVARFHEDFTRDALDQGWLRLYVLRAADVPAASIYGLRYGDVSYFYQSGLDPRFAGFSPGLVAMGLAIQAAIEEGVKEYDLLHGAEAYKYLWATGERSLSRLELYPPGLRAAVNRYVVETSRVAKVMARGVLESAMTMTNGNDSERLRVNSPSLRTVAKSAVANTLHWTGADRLFSAAAGMRRLPVVVAYHRVVEDFRPAPNGSTQPMLVTRRTLEQHLDWIGRRYRFVSLDDADDWMESGGGPGGPVAAITFDDGYSDVYEHAFPLLRRKGIPAAVFVVTNLVGSAEPPVHDRLYVLLTHAFERWTQPVSRLAGILSDLGTATTQWFRPWRRPPTAHEVMCWALETLPQADVLGLIAALAAEPALRPKAPDFCFPMGWQMLSTMRSAGFTIGSHTMSHVLLANERPERVWAEVQGSRAELERRLGVPVQHLAYPNGSFSPGVIAAVKAAGYRFAYTSCPHRHDADPLLTIPRKVLWENSCRNTLGEFSPAILSCHLHGILGSWECRLRHQDRQFVECGSPSRDMESRHAR